MVLSNSITEGEKKDLKNKISELETHKAATDRQAEELNTRVAELEAQNSSFEIQLKTTNEQQVDITPLREQALLIRRKTYQVQLQLAKEVYKIKRAETRL